MKTLTDIVVHASQIEVMLIESGGEITPEIDAMISARDIQLPEKIDAYSTVLDRLDIIEQHYREKANQFLLIAKSIMMASERCKDNLKSAMMTLDTNELLGNDYRFKLQNSKPAVQFNNEELIPDDYKRKVETIVIDKKRIYEDLTIGIPVAGCNLSHGKSLRKFINKSK
jgi:hypothetical protein